MRIEIIIKEPVLKEAYLLDLALVFLKVCLSFSFPGILTAVSTFLSRSINQLLF
jgi:hypothetical protein